MSVLDYLIVVNPISGGNDKTDFYTFIEAESSRQNFSYQIYKTTGQNDADVLRKLIANTNPKTIVAVGGDGTLLLIAQIVKRTKIRIGLIPFGSANGMSKELEIPKIPDINISLDPHQRFKLCWGIIRKERVRTIDLLQINKQYFSMHLSDIGLNAKIVKRFDAEKIRGYFGYARLAFKVFRQRKQIAYELVADRETYDGKAYMIVIANATMYGTGAVINPIGILTDGIFEICIIKKISLSGFIRLLYSSIHNTKPDRTDLIQIITCEKASIAVNDFETLQVDGEVVGEVNKVDVEIIPAAIKIIC